MSKEWNKQKIKVNKSQSMMSWKWVKGEQSSSEPKWVDSVSRECWQLVDNEWGIENAWSETNKNKSE